MATKENNNNTNTNTNTQQKLLNEPSKTIFLQNVNYTATENDLKAFFSKFGVVVYAKICKSNGVSKGTAFVMFSKREDCESVVNTYNKCVANKESELNPFEFEGKFLKIFQAYDKNDSSQIPVKKEDRRNREFMLFGLYNNYNGELNDSDKEKREFIMKSKKDNFKNNPNLFTSKTRLTIRNFAKNVEENELRKKILEASNKWISEIKDLEKKKHYERTKKIKQVKIIRDPKNNNKSKGTAFAEMFDEELAKGTILKLSNIPLREDDDRGLIVDFALEDARKIHKRELINQSKKAKQEQRKHDLLVEKLKDKKNKDDTNFLKLNEDKENKNKNNKKQNNNITPLTEISDENLLMKMLYECNSRGKKQRIQKRLMAVKNIDREELLKLVASQRNKYQPVKAKSKKESLKKGDKNKEDEYHEEVIENERTNINKKSKQQKRKDKKEEKMLAKKRKRDEIEKQREEEEMEGGMNQYFQMIEKKLKDE